MARPKFGGNIVLEGADEYKRNLKTINGELKLLSKEMEVNGKSTENLNKQIDLYNKKIDEQKKHINSIEKALKEENEAEEKNVDTIAKLQQKLVYAKATLLDMEKGLKSAQSELDTFGTKAKQAAYKLSQTGEKLSNMGSKTENFSKALAAVAAASTKFSSDFEMSFAKVSTLITDGDIDINALAADTLKLSNAVNVSASDLNEAFYSALSAGVEINTQYGDTLDFLEQNSKIATAGFTDMQTAIDTTTTILNAYGMQIEETSRIHETLVNTQNLGKTTVAELGASLSQVVPTAAALGVDIEQVGAAFAAMTAQGIPTAQAATQIRSALSELSKDGQTAYTNFEKLSGKSFKEFIDGGGTLSQAMKILADGAKDTGKEVNSMFGSVEAANTALVLSGDTGFAKFNESLEQMRGSVGVVDEAFEKMSETTQYKTTKAINELKNAGAELGMSLLPVIEQFAGDVSKFAEWFSNLDESTKKSIAQFMLFGAALAPVLLTLGKTITTVSGLVGVVGNLSTALPALAAAMPAVGTIAAIAAAITGIIVAGNEFEKFIAGTTELSEEERRELEELERQIERTKNKTEDISRSYETEKESIEDNVTAKKANAAVLRELVPRLEELANKTDRTTGEEIELNGVIDKLNDNFPDLGLAIDETTGKLNKQVDSIYDAITAYEKLAEAQAYQARYDAAVKNKANLQIARDQSIADAAQAYAKLNEENRKALNLLYQKIDQGKEITDEYFERAVANAIPNTLLAMEGDPYLEAFLKSVDNYQNAYGALSKAIGETSKAKNDYAKYLGEQRGQSNKAGGNNKGGEKKDNKVPQVSDVSELSDIVKAGLETWQYRYDAGLISTEEYIKQLTRIRDEYFVEDSKAWREYDLKIINLQKSMGADAAKAVSGGASAATKAVEDETDKSLEALKKAYQSQQAFSYDWISERVYKGDFADFKTTANESYERIYQRAREAFNAGILSIDELADEADRITAAKLADYNTEKQKLTNFIDDRNFYDDWSAVNTSEEKVLQQMLDNADRYYAEGVLDYRQYAEEVRQINRQIFSAQASTQETIMQAAQDRVQEQLDQKRAEIDSQIAALNQQVSDLRSRYTAQDRQKRLAELREEISDFQSAVTIRGQEHLKELEAEAERLRREQEIEELQKKNAQIIEQLEAEYRAMETEKTSLLSKIADNTAQWALMREAINGIGESVSNAVSTTFTKIVQDNSTRQNINNNSVTQNINAAQTADVFAAVAAVVRSFK